MSEKGNMGILLIGIIIAFLLPVTVNYNFVMLSILDTELETFAEKIGVRLGLAFSDPEDIDVELSDIDKEMAQVWFKKIMIEYQEEYGFQKSYKKQLLISEKYKLKEKPGILDGIKNGFISMMTPILNIVKLPCGIIKLLFTGEAKYILGYILYLLISSITCFIALLFMKASILYYVGFFFGVILGMAIISVSTES